MVQKYVTVISSDGYAIAVPASKLNTVAQGIGLGKDRATWHSIFNVQVLCQIPQAFCIKQ